MDPQTVFCPNLACPARGQVGKGNIGIHSKLEGRYLCRQCGQTFAARKETAFHRLRTPEATVTIVVTLLAYGCPLQAVVKAYGFDERTVAAWQARAGVHCQQVHAHLVEQPRDLGAVQADEIWCKLQKLKVWMAMALQVSTRLWLGGVVSPHRNRALIQGLVRKIRACARPRPLLISVDGLETYVKAIRLIFRQHTPGRAQKGQHCWQLWAGLCITQVVKSYAKRRLVEVQHRIVQGTSEAVAALIALSQGAGGINTAFIERLNATYRSRLHHLVRRGRGLARQALTLERDMYLLGAVYNFCTFHGSLRTARPAEGTRRRWDPRTPAMAAGLTDHRWSVLELLTFRVPPPRWRPPSRRGRWSKDTHALVEKWCR
jgi:transposase-like protein